MRSITILCFAALAVPAFLKRFEVHIPVKPKPKEEKPAE
jgi:hypothetical protein